MRVGLLADIHGNAHALSAVLEAATRAAVDRLIVAGDLVGYYYEPDRVLSLLADWPWIGVRGNHEEMLGRWCQGQDRADIRRRYGQGLAVAQERLSADQLDRLLALPHPTRCEVDGCRVLIGHGSPWDIDDYVYPDAPPDRRARLLALDADLVVLGHTHYPMLWRQDRIQVVNPGSVGQPRDRKPGACWALWETASGSITLRREAYDMRPVLAQAERRDPDLPNLRHVLTRTC